MNDYVEPEAPSPDDSDDTTRTLVNAIWQDGWKHGHSAGYKIGFTNGSSTLGRTWFFVTALIFLIGGVFFGMSMPILLEWLNTPVPQ